MFQMEPSVLVTSNNTTVANGSFAVNAPQLVFETCRERFSKVFLQETEVIFFTHAGGKGENIAKFIHKTEQILLQNEFSKFATTNRPNVLWMMPSSFWRSCRMKRSLFTILLRSGANYEPEKDNYETALFSDPYALSTKKAVMRFLYGFTEFKGNQSDSATAGWKSTFQDKDETSIKNNLSSAKVFICLPELSNALWA